MGPGRRMGEGGAGLERGAELVSVCVCGAGAEEECDDIPSGITFKLNPALSWIILKLLFRVSELSELL